METTKPTHFELGIQISIVTMMIFYSVVLNEVIIMILYGYRTRSFIVICHQVITAGKRFSIALEIVKIVQMNCVTF